MSRGKIALVPEMINLQDKAQNFARSKYDTNKVRDVLETSDANNTYYSYGINDDINILTQTDVSSVLITFRSLPLHY